MTSGEELAQYMITFLAFFSPAFIVFIVIEWLLGLFRHDY